MSKPKKKPGADLPLPEELLDRSIGLLEGPLNSALERVMKSRVLLWPIGLSQALLWKSAGLMLGRPWKKPIPHKVRSGQTSSSSSSSSSSKQER